MSDNQYCPVKEACDKLMRAQVIQEQVDNGTYVDTIEPKKMHPVDKICIDAKLIEVYGVRNETN